MVSGGARRVAAIAGIAAAVGGGAVIANAQQPAPEPCPAESKGGGLALCTPREADQSITINRVAQAGAADRIFVVNNSGKALDVTAKARPWTQSASGATSPNRRSELGGVSVSEEAFTLAPGTKKELTVTLNGVPASGYVYGALEVIGLPSDLESRKGVVLGYRLVSALRYRAATATSALKAGAAKFAGSGKDKTLTLAVRNTGNTIEPVTGSVRLRSALGTRNASIKATRILPGKSVRLGLFSGSALREGTYTARITLVQAGKRTTVTKKITVRR